MICTFFLNLDKGANENELVAKVFLLKSMTLFPDDLEENRIKMILPHWYSKYVTKMGSAA